MIKCECGGTMVKEPHCRTWYCTKCFRHVTKLRKPKLSGSVRSLQSYYRKKGLITGYLTIKQAAKMKNCTFMQIQSNLSLFDTKTKKQNKIIIMYNYKLIMWEVV